MSEWLKEAASKTVDRPKAVRRFESCRFRSCKGLAKVLANPFCIFPPPHQTVRKVLARLKYSVPRYKARNGFSILTEEYLTFQTVSPLYSINAALPQPYRPKKKIFPQVRQKRLHLDNKILSLKIATRSANAMKGHLPYAISLLFTIFAE